MSAPVAVREFAVDEDCPRRIAKALVRYRFTRPLFLSAVVMEVLVVAVFLASGETGLGVFVAVLIVAIVGLPWATMGRQAAMMRARGFQPHTTVTVAWGALDFTITAAQLRSTHRYDQVRQVVEMGDVIGFRLRDARLLVALPAQLVPTDVIAYLRPGRAAASPPRA